jgi:hypothetical protein
MPNKDPVDASPEELLRILANSERLAIAGSLALGPKTAAQLREVTGMANSRLRRHLARMLAVGLIRPEADPRTYRLEPEALRHAAQEIGPSREAGLALGAVDDEEESVLRAYFRGGRLKEIPAKQSKRRIVLSRLALEFDVGVHYPERHVNQTLKRFHDDYAALRRWMVDEGFLSRDKGKYWRSGGPVEV